MRTQLSMMMTAPSMMIPKSSAPRLMRLPEMPNQRMATKVISRARGIVKAVINAARMLPTSRSRMTATRIAPVTRLCSTVSSVALTSTERS